jgi:hypothetical protein
MVSAHVKNELAYLLIKYMHKYVLKKKTELAGHNIFTMCMTCPTPAVSDRPATGVMNQHALVLYGCLIFKLAGDKCFKTD